MIKLKNTIKDLLLAMVVFLVTLLILITIQWDSQNYITFDGIVPHVVKVEYK